MDKWIKQHSKKVWINKKYPNVFIEYNKINKLFIVFKGKDMNSYREFKNNEFGKAVRYAESIQITNDASKDFGRASEDRKIFYDVNGNYS